MSQRRTSSLRFGKEFSLRSDRLIRDLLLTGKRYSGRLLAIHYSTGEDFQQRYCIRVPKHVGNAVTRNRVKRIIRENLRNMLNDIGQGTTAVIRVRRCDYEDLPGAIRQDLRDFAANG